MFGPLSLRRMREEDILERNVEGYLPSAKVAFLDEIWNAPSAVLNTLLLAIGDHRFRNGRDMVEVPLRIVIASASRLPDAEADLARLWDRILFRIPVSAINDRDSFIALLQQPVADNHALAVDALGDDELAKWDTQIATVELPSAILDLVYDIRERIARHNSMSDDADPAAGLFVSDRRWKHAIHVLRTSAFLNDRSAVSPLDTVLLRHILWSREEQRETIDTIIREALRRYSRSGTFDPEPFRIRTTELLESVRVAGLTVETIEQPVEYRGEYYRVLDFVEDHLSLIWIGDYQALDETTSRETDLFFYGEDDEYAYSERFAVRRVDPATIEIDGEPFSVETMSTEHERPEPSEIAPADRKQMIGKIGELETDIATIVAAIEDARTAGDREALEHLFVHRSYADLVFEGMDEAIVELTRLKLELDESRAALQE